MVKYLCLGFMDESIWERMPEQERNALMDACFVYDDELRRNGHMIGGEALQSSRTAATVRYRGGSVSVTDGPFVETKEQLGGILMLEARDLNHAIQLISSHPSVRSGSSWEVRPAADVTGMMTESERRRQDQRE